MIQQRRMWLSDQLSKNDTEKITSKHWEFAHIFACKEEQPPRRLFSRPKANVSLKKGQGRRFPKEKRLMSVNEPWQVSSGFGCYSGAWAGVSVESLVYLLTHIIWLKCFVWSSDHTSGIWSWRNSTILFFGGKVVKQCTSSCFITELFRTSKPRGKTFSRLIAAELNKLWNIIQLLKNIRYKNHDSKFNL